MAEAAPVCADLQRVMTAAADGHPELRGEKIADCLWKSTLVLDGAELCVVYAAPDQTLFACRRSFRSTEKAGRVYEEDAAFASPAFRTGMNCRA